MIGQGGSVSHGLVLKDYFRRKAENDWEPEVFRIEGTATPDDYDKSFDEILLSGMLSKGDKSAYHLIINPSTKEADLTPEQWHVSIDEYLSVLNYEKQKHIAVKHTKHGREHMHVIIDRFDYETNKLLPDNNNWYKHQTASTNLERMFGHEETPRRTDYKKLSPHKDIITEIWHNTHDGRSFLAALEDAGYHVGRRTDKHPYRVIAETSEQKKSLDLVRQIKGVDHKAVAERLAGIEIQTEREAYQKASQSTNLIITNEKPDFKYLANFKEGNDPDDQEDREKEKKHLSELEAKISSLEDDVELLDDKEQPKKLKLSERLKQKRRDRDQDQDLTF